MSIASEITRISGNVADAYTAISGKGGTLPANQNSDNLATTIATIPTGTTPTGTKSITANGVYDVTDFASADVQVPTTAPAHYVEKSVSSGKLVNSANIIDLTGVTDIGNYVLCGQYKGVSFPQNTNIDLSNLTSITGEHALEWAFSQSSVKSIDLSGVTIISGSNAFANACQNCSALENVYFSNLTSVTKQGVFQSAFSSSGLKTINFSKLNVISYDFGSFYLETFRGCVYLESIEFGGLTASTFVSKKTQLQNLFADTTGRDAPNGCTVHFPSNFDPSDPNHTFDASTLTGYPTFGGSASYIHLAYDLPATE